MGNHNRKQAALDFTGSLTDDEALLGRVIGVWRDSDTQTDYVDDNSLIFAPSLSWQATDRTKLTLLGNWQKNESGSSTQFFPHQGTLLDNEFGQIPSHRFVSEPGFDRYDTEQQSVTAIIEHDLNQDWRLRLASRYSDSHADYRTMYAWPPVFQDDNRTVIRSISMSDNSAISVTSDMQLADFNAGRTLLNAQPIAPVIRLLSLVLTHFAGRLCFLSHMGKNHEYLQSGFHQLGSLLPGVTLCPPR